MAIRKKKPARRFLAKLIARMFPLRALWRELRDPDKWVIGTRHIMYKRAPDDLRIEQGRYSFDAHTWFVNIGGCQVPMRPLARWRLRRKVRKLLLQKLNGRILF